MNKVIPRIMSTQHPDNITIPEFDNKKGVIDGVGEEQEGIYVFEKLGVDEQMLDCDGKKPNINLVRGMLEKNPEFFRKNRLGERKFITLRVPNPSVEPEDAKLLLSTLESIPSAYDVANSFYEGSDIAPIFEVILPMTTSSICLDRIYDYYLNFIGKKGEKSFSNSSTLIKEWLGDFFPKKINVIPLFEDEQSMLNSHNILYDYLKNKKDNHVRVFLAKSDPALNFGLVASVLLNKVALENFYRLEKKLGINIYPILGVGSSPFRGNLKPTNIKNCLLEFPSVQTFTIQSAFKYDYPEYIVRNAIKGLYAFQRSVPHNYDHEDLMCLIEKTSEAYQSDVAILAPIINSVANHVPKRRERKMHTGLFGYNRQVNGQSLPRAITFVASCYTIGIPPEILGLESLDSSDIKELIAVYPTIRDDVSESLKYLSEENLQKVFGRKKARLLTKKATIIAGGMNKDNEHVLLSEAFLKIQNNSVSKSVLPNLLQEAAKIRKFLG